MEPATIVAFIVGALVGSVFERWLLWRRFTDSRWSYQRLIWFGYRPAEARRQAADFATTAETVRIHHPLLMVRWLVQRHRWALAGLVLALLLAGAAAALAG
jgi:hypothetical protein